MSPYTPILMRPAWPAYSCRMLIGACNLMCMPEARRQASEKGMLGGLVRARNVLLNPEQAREDHYPNSLLYLYAALLQLNEPFQ